MDMDWVLNFGARVHAAVDHLLKAWLGEAALVGHSGKHVELTPGVRC